MPSPASVSRSAAWRHVESRVLFCLVWACGAWSPSRAAEPAPATPSAGLVAAQQARAAADSIWTTARTRDDSLRSVAVLDSVVGALLATATDWDVYAGIDSLLADTIPRRSQLFGAASARLANGLDALASFRFNLAQYGPALPVREQCFAIRTRLLPPGDPLLAQERAALGDNYFQLARYTDARPHLQAAVPVLERARPKQSVALVSALLAVAELRRIENRFAAAESCLLHTVVVVKTDLASDSLLVAKVHNNLAGVYKDEGRFDEAEPLLREWLAACTGELNPDPVQIATAKLNVAEVYRLQGRTAEAETLYVQALDVARSFFPADSPELALYVNQLAVLYREQERFAAAEARTREALAILQSAPDARDKLAESQFALGEVLRAQGRPADAALAYQDAITTRVELLGPKHPEVAIARIGLARCKMTAPDGRAAAAALLEEAIQALDGTASYPEARIDAHATRATLFDSEGDRPRAIAELATALHIVEDLRSRRGSADVRAGFLGSHAALFDDMVQWCAESGDVARAFEYAERGRGRVFLDQLAAARLDAGSGKPNAARKALDASAAEARVQLQSLRAQIEQTLARTDLTAAARQAQLAALAQQSDRTTVALDRTLEEIRRANPQWRRAVQAAAQPIPLTAVVRTLGSPHALLLEYVLGARASWVFVAGDSGFAPACVPLRIESSDAAVLGVDPGPLRAGIAAAVLAPATSADQGASPDTIASRARGVSTPKRVSQAAVRRQALGNVLLPPAVRHRLRHCRDAVIVPDGALHSLAFESLPLGGTPDGTQDWLAAGPVVRYAASATALKDLMQVARGAPKTGPNTVLCVADPAFSSTASVGALTSSEDTLPPLPGTRREAEIAQAAFGKGQVTVLSGARASEASFRAALPGKNIVHIGTHGLVDPGRNAVSAGLALAPGKGATTLADDGLLQLFEIYGLRLQADLVVLSACDTGTGSFLSGEGVFSLARAFLAAGAGRVVASLWPVDDAATAELMARFYERVAAARKQGAAVDFAQTLRDAKRDVRAQPQWADPYYWAGFIVTGVR